MSKYLGVIVSIGCVAAFFWWLPTPEKKVKAEIVTVISNATVFTGNEWLENADVAFEKGVIIEVSKNIISKYNNPTIVDAKGQYLIPGLIDAHTHAWGGALKQAVRFGVTTELDLFTNVEFAAAQRKLRDEDDWDVQQADLFSAGTLITGPDGHGTEYGVSIPVIKNAGEADAFVAQRIAEGSDYIKIVYDVHSTWMPSINRETLNAVVHAAKSQHKLVVVHVNNLLSAEHAISAGANGLAHSFMDNLEDGAMDELIRVMKENKSFIIPTLSVLGSMIGQGASPSLQRDFTASGYDLEGVEAALKLTIGEGSYAARFASAKKNVYRFIQAGVPVLAGTDAPNPGMVHGLSLHNELELLVQSGLTPTEALQSATIVPAKAFGLQRRGEVSSGMKADFILLRKNPKDNIRHTRSIASIYKNGFIVRKNKATTMAGTVSSATNLGDFEIQKESQAKTGASNILDYSWHTTTDEMAQGNSTATFQIVEGANNNHFMNIKGVIGDKFPFPWSGIYMPFTDNQETGLNLSQLTSIDFQAQGTTGSYRMLLFSTNQPLRPIELNFTVSNKWDAVSVPLSAVNSGLLKSISGVAIVGGAEHDEFELNIDDIWLR